MQGLLGQLSESSLVQPPHLCLQDLLPTSTYQSYLFLLTYLQASCRSLHSSKHLTCASRTRSQPQPVEILSMLISRQVVGVFTRPNTSLVSPGLTPNFSLSRYIQALHKKTCRLRQSIDKSHFSNDLTANMPQKWSETQAHHLNPDYSSSSMPLTLHQQYTNLVSTANP